ncbi:hypothetical protein M3221_11520 [Domibacillus indicus]|uniref:hypothetical protein n=1 Tax=Domibacillus indicus TaxID=1437523 RepID=UPI002040A46E|nr:hypothetical protein [Domibacillus indicus]MCM3789034.1 hypothetical protein [Domibacillus indicus]
MEEHTSFWQGPAISLTLAFFFGAISSPIPEESYLIFGMNMGLSFLALILAYYRYRIKKEGFRYKALTAFTVFFLSGFFMVMRLLRTTFHTLLFYPMLIFYLFMLIYSMLIAKTVLPGLSRFISQKAAAISLVALFFINVICTFTVTVATC